MRLALNLWFLMAPLAASLSLGALAYASHGRRRIAWTLIAGSTGAWFLGQVGWAYQDLHRGFVMRPSLPDVAFALTIPLAIAGVLLLWQRRAVRWFGVRAIMEGTIIALSLFVAMWVFVLKPAPTGKSWLFYAYAVGPIVILTGALLVLPRVSLMGRWRRLCLGGSILLIAAGNAASLVLNSFDAYYIGHPIDLLWLTGFLLLAAFGAMKDRPQARPPKPHKDLPAPSPLTYALIGVAIVAASYDTLRVGSLDAAIFAAGCILVMALIALQRLAQIDARTLALTVARQADDLRRSNVELERERVRLEQAQSVAGLAAWQWRPGDEALQATLGGWERLGMVQPLSRATVDPQDWRSLTEALQEVAVGRRASVDLHVRARTRDGRTQWVRVWSESGETDDRLVRGLAQDITMIKEMEQVRWQALERESEVRRLREVDQMRATFINVAAHELNTPLTPLRLQLAVLRRTLLPSGSPEGKRSFDVMERSVQRLAHLVKDLLDTGRLQAGRMKFHFAPVDLAKMASDAVESYQPAARQAGVGLSCQLHVAALMAKADAQRFHEVLDNLLSNAIKFTPSGGRVEVVVHEDDRQGSIEIRDTGVGLDEEGLRSLFQPFSQSGPAVRRGETGTGLGLYIAHGIVAAHRGTLRAESAGRGQGSVFRILVPTLPHGAAPSRGAEPQSVTF